MDNIHRMSTAVWVAFAHPAGMVSRRAPEPELVFVA